MTRVVVVLAALVGTACNFKTGEFACTSDIECVRTGVQGTCELVGFCSFPDSSCTEGRRFGDHSGAYTNLCFGEDPGADAALPDAPPGFYRIGGTVSGLTGTLVLRNNGVDDLTRTTNGGFTFPLALADGSAYAVTVGTAPANQTVTIQKGSGTLAGAEVTDVDVTCTSIGGDPGIRCGAMFCTLAQECCTNPATCGNNNCQGATLQCDDFADCGTTNVCCVYYNAGLDRGDAICRTKAACDGFSMHDYLCDPGAAIPCPTGGVCTLIAAGDLAGYHACK